MKKIEIYTKNNCSFCDNAKIFFKSKNLSFIEYNIEENYNYLEEMLQRSKGKKLMPQIFINNYHIGGYDNLRNIIDSGDFKKILNS